MTKLYHFAILLQPFPLKNFSTWICKVQLARLAGWQITSLIFHKVYFISRLNAYNSAILHIY